MPHHQHMQGLVLHDDQEDPSPEHNDCHKDRVQANDLHHQGAQGLHHNCLWCDSPDSASLTSRLTVHSSNRIHSHEDYPIHEDRHRPRLLHYRDLQDFDHQLQPHIDLRGLHHQPVPSFQVGAIDCCVSCGINALTSHALTSPQLLYILPISNHHQIRLPIHDCHHQVNLLSIGLHREHKQVRLRYLMQANEQGSLPNPRPTSVPARSTSVHPSKANLQGLKASLRHDRDWTYDARRSTC